MWMLLKGLPTLGAEAQNPGSWYEMVLCSHLKYPSTVCIFLHFARSKAILKSEFRRECRAVDFLPTNRKHVHNAYLGTGTVTEFLTEYLFTLVPSAWVPLSGTVSRHSVGTLTSSFFRLFDWAASCTESKTPCFIPLKIEYIRKVLSIGCVTTDFGHSYILPSLYRGHFGDKRRDTSWITTRTRRTDREGTGKSTTRNCRR